MMKLAITGPFDPRELREWIDVPPTRTGISGGPIVTDFIKGLLRSGESLTVVGLDAEARDVERYDGHRVRLYLGQRRPRHRARDAYRAERAILRAALLDAQPDVIHAHWTYEFALGALATGVPTIVTAHDWAPAIFRLQPSPYFFVRMLMNFAALAQRPPLLVSSPYMLAKMRRWTGSSVTLIPNAVTDDWFIKPQQIRVDDTTTPTVIAINNGWGRRKNVSRLLEAWPQVLERVPGARLRLVGSAYDAGGEAQVWARRRGLDTAVEFVGQLPYESLPGELSGADLFVHPSVEESFGMVLIEAMARGVPVLAGQRSGAVGWVCKDGRAADLVDVRNSGAIAVEVTALLQNPQRRLLLAHAGHRRAWDAFRLSGTVEQHVARYREILRGSTTTAP